MNNWIIREDVAHVSSSNDRVIDSITQYFHKSDRPVYLGEVAVQVGRNLAQVEALFEIMIERGIIRHASPGDCCDVGFNPTAEVYVLTSDKISLRKAYTP